MDFPFENPPTDAIGNTSRTIPKGNVSKPSLVILIAVGNFARLTFVLRAQGPLAALLPFSPLRQQANCTLRGGICGFSVTLQNTSVPQNPRGFMDSTSRRFRHGNG
jgi:hypothetical protein